MSLQERHYAARSILGPESTAGTSVFLIADGIVQIVMDADSNESHRSTESGSANSAFDEDATGDLHPPNLMLPAIGYASCPAY